MRTMRLRHAQRMVDAAGWRRLLPALVAVAVGLGVLPAGGSASADTLPTVRFPMARPKVVEGPAGSHTFLQFTFRLNATPTAAVTVSYATSDGTASAPRDYRSTAGRLSIPAGQRSAVLPVLVRGDDTWEPDETVNVTITGVTGATLGDPIATYGYIVNDDPLQPGGVTGWGNNSWGQSTMPPAAQSGVSAIAAGYWHSLALKNGGVIAWGKNLAGQTKVPLVAQSGVTAIAAGDLNSLALRHGRVIVWGSNNYGGTNVPVDAQSGVTAIAAGDVHNLALKYGRVIAWGSTYWGWRTFPRTPSPESPPSPQGITSVWP